MWKIRWISEWYFSRKNFVTYECFRWFGKIRESIIDEEKVIASGALKPVNGEVVELARMHTYEDYRGKALQSN